MMADGKAAAQQLDHVEAVAFRHLHIEKHQVRLRSANLLDGVQPGPAFGDGSDVRITPQQHGQVAPRQWFVVDHQDPYGRRPLVRGRHSCIPQGQRHGYFHSAGIGVSQLQFEFAAVQDLQAGTQIADADAGMCRLPIRRQARAVVVDTQMKTAVAAGAGNANRRLRRRAWRCRA